MMEPDLVHIAPAFGADDMEVANVYNLPVIQTVAPDGSFVSEVKPWSGMFVKTADPLIIEDLTLRGSVVQTKHNHPHLSILLALSYAFALLCPPDMVCTHQPV